MFSIMLVLTLKRGEGAHVGDLGRVSVVRVNANSVRVGFEFQRDIEIERDDVRARRRLLNQQLQSKGDPATCSMTT
jgi:carbon storage regulator CsrA